MTTTVAKAPKCRKVNRTVKVLIPLDTEPSVGVVRVTEGRKVEDYCLWRQPAEGDDRGFRLAKLNDPDHDGYDVSLSGGFYTCECKGYLRWSRCRHGQLLVALETAGKV